MHGQQNVKKKEWRRRCFVLWTFSVVTRTKAWLKLFSPFLAPHRQLRRIQINITEERSNFTVQIRLTATEKTGKRSDTQQ